MVVRHFRAIALISASLFGLFTGMAHATPRPVTIVKVTPKAQTLDAEKLRAQISDELGSDAVSPEDPRAESATGTITVDVDETNQQLSVSYVECKAELKRFVPLPPNSADARAEVVVLAGNLARDEASDLAQQLRKQNVAQESAPSASVRNLDSPSSAPKRVEFDVKPIRGTLDYYAGEARSMRLAMGWTFVATGAVVLGASVYHGYSEPETSDWFVPATLGGVTAGLGLIPLLVTDPLEDLAEYSHKTESLQAIEGAWEHAATRERKRRLQGGVASVAVGALEMGVGIFTLMSDVIDDPSSRLGTGMLLLVGGALIGGTGVYSLSADGPVERSLKAYRLTSGRPSVSEMPRVSNVHFGLVPGGAISGISGVF